MITQTAIHHLIQRQLQPLRQLFIRISRLYFQQGRQLRRNRKLARHIQPACHEVSLLQHFGNQFFSILHRQCLAESDFLLCLRFFH